MHFITQKQRRMCVNTLVIRSVSSDTECKDVSGAYRLHTQQNSVFAQSSAKPAPIFIISVPHKSALAFVLLSFVVVYIGLAALLLTGRVHVR